MSALVLCPECKRKLKVPDTAVGKTIRCPMCKASIPPVTGPASDTEDAEPHIPSRPRSVKTAPPPRTAPRGQLNREEDMEDEDDDAPVEEKPIRKKPSRKRRPIRKKSSAGPIIGLAVGGVLLLIVLLGSGFAVFRYFSRSRTIPEAEWQSFSPPNSGCSVLMPGTPVPQPMNVIGVTMRFYEVKRLKENAAFSLAICEVPPHVVRPSLLEDMTKGSRDGILAQISGAKVTSETSITLGNLPGREIQLQRPTRGSIIARWYLAKIGNTHRAYAVVAEGDYIQPNKGDAARFLDSFKIDASATPPTFDNAAPPFGPQQPPVVNPPPATPGAMPPQPNPGPMPPQANPQPQPPQPRPRLPRLPRRGPGTP